MTRSRSPTSDPKPEPPPQPDLEACCGQGCNPCIFDLYEEARQRYAADLQAWETRQAERARGKGKKTGSGRAPDRSR